MSVVVTGLGAVGNWGREESELAAALAQEHCATAPVGGRFGRPLGARRAALVGGRDFSPHLSPLAARRMSAPAQFAVYAAHRALESARLEALPGGAAVTLATTFGPTGFTEELLEQIVAEGPDEASPLLFAGCVANAPAAQVALRLKARGPNVTITQREAGPVLGLARGADLVARGRAPLALAGAVDEMTPFTHALLDRFRALARGDERARPFDPRRDGYVAGEGAALFVLEPEESARARGAPLRVRVRGSIRAADPTAPAHDWGEGGKLLARRLARGLERLGLAPGDLDRVVSAASGSRRGDRLEADILERLFGAKRPPVFTPKSVTGEYGGGALAAALLLAEGASRTLVSGLSSGGAAAWIVLETIR